MHRSSWMLLVFLLGACRAASTESNEPSEAPVTSVNDAEPTPSGGAVAPSEPSFTVRTYGSLSEIMHAGRVGPSVALASLPTSGLYAVGALSELRGEVTILAGESWLSYPAADDGIRIASGLEDEQATLLVTAQVEHWQSIAIERDVEPAELDATLEQLARAAGYDVDSRLPMRIEGPVRELGWHVLDGVLDGGMSGHGMSARRGVLTSERASLVGFFSKRDQGVFTHMGSHSHWHVIDVQARVAGHVDTVTVLRGATLLLPGTAATR